MEELNITSSFYFIEPSGNKAYIYSSIQEDEIPPIAYFIIRYSKENIPIIRRINNLINVLQEKTSQLIPFTKEDPEYLSFLNILHQSIANSEKEENEKDLMILRKKPNLPL